MNALLLDSVYCLYENDLFTSHSESMQKKGVLDSKTDLFIAFLLAHKNKQNFVVLFVTCGFAPCVA